MIHPGEEVSVRVEGGDECTGENCNTTIRCVTHAITIVSLRGFLMRSCVEMCALVGITSRAEALIGLQQLEHV